MSINELCSNEVDCIGGAVGICIGIAGGLEIIIHFDVVNLTACKKLVCNDFIDDYIYIVDRKKDVKRRCPIGTYNYNKIYPATLK